VLPFSHFQTLQLVAAGDIPHADAIVGARHVKTDAAVDFVVIAVAGGDELRTVGREEQTEDGIVVRRENVRWRAFIGNYFYWRCGFFDRRRRRPVELLAAEQFAVAHDLHFAGKNLDFKPRRFTAFE